MEEGARWLIAILVVVLPVISWHVGATFARNSERASSLAPLEALMRVYEIVRPNLTARQALDGTIANLRRIIEDRQRGWPSSQATQLTAFADRSKRGAPTKRVTVEIVARMDVPADTPLNRVLNGRDLDIPLIVVPTEPGNGWDVPAEMLTYQFRVTEGDRYLHPEPYRREFT